MHGVVFRGRRYDTGDRLDYLKTVVRLACERDDLGPDFCAWLRTSSGEELRPMTDLKSVDEHLADVLAGIEPLAPLDLQLLDAHGCILAETVTAEVDLPPFDNSSMDGYAVRFADVASASEATPVQLPVVGDVAAGSQATYTVQPGLCVRIMTGAPVPAGADAVVPVEWTDGGIAAVAITQAPEVGAAHPAPRRGRRAGERCSTPAPGSAPASSACWPPSAATGCVVRPRPRVVIISTGSELVEPGTRTAQGQIPESNTYILTTAAREAGAIAFRVGIVPDDARDLDGHDRGPADPGRPGRHQRRRQRRRLRRGQGGAVAARHGGLREGGDAAGQAAGLRHRRPGHDADHHAARQPGAPTSPSRCSSGR